MTDKEKVAHLFRHSSGRNIYLMEIIEGLRIVEYSGRISDVRKEWDCTCGKDVDTCQANEHIVNVKKGWYQYKSNKTEVKQEYIKPVNEAAINYKLSLLREKYRKAENDIDKRLIQLQANILKNTLNTYNKEQVSQTVATMKTDEVMGVLA